MGNKQCATLAFQSQCWRDAKFTYLQLTRVFRQKDLALVACLEKVRTGLVDSSVMEMFCTTLNRPLAPRADGIKPTVLLCTNRDVRKQNDRELAKLPGESVHYAAVDTVHAQFGDQDGANFSMVTCL